MEESLESDLLQEQLAALQAYCLAQPEISRQSPRLEHADSVSL